MRFLVSAFLLVVLLAGCTSGPERVSSVQQVADRPPVLLVSIDGFRADYLMRGQTPTLSRLADDGVRAEAMRPSFPSLTFPNHTTLVTGRTPDHHGIVNNVMEDPSMPGRRFTPSRPEVEDPRWWQDATPLWITAERQNIRTATMFWPGSDVAIQGVHPSRYRDFDGKVPPAERVDTVLQWLDLPAGQRPQFLTLYFDQIDTAGHEFGPDSDALNAPLRDVDGALARLVDGLQRRGLTDRINLVIVADHGMSATPPEQTVYLDDLVRKEDIRVVTAGPVAGLSIAASAKKGAVERKLLRAHEHMTCWRKGEIPARLRYGTHVRVPPIVCSAADGWVIATRGGNAKDKHVSLGRHGYDPAYPSMGALFVANGPSFRKHLVVPPFDNVDVYPLLARLTGVTPEPNDGNAATGEAMLKSPQP